MTTRQRLHELVDQLSDAEVEDLTQFILKRCGTDDGRAHPEMAELPEAWQRFSDGSPVPNWVRLIDEVRSAQH
jgi:hypothetical protein